MYGDVVLRVPRHEFEKAMHEVKKARGVDVRHGPDGRGPGGDRPARRADRARSGRATTFPTTRASSSGARSRAVFRSWDNERAKTYRKLHHIPDDWGTAVNVQAMVFGNRGDDLGDGRRVHARPGDRREEVLRRVPAERAGRGRRRGHPHAAAARTPTARGCRSRRRCRRRTPSSQRRARAPREALPRHAGPRVHDRGGQALPAADAQRQAHRASRPCASRPTWWTRA